MGHRVDVICIIEGIIFLLEFKVGDKEYKKSTTDQVMDYALDLKYFHDKSRTRYLVPINVSTKAVEIQNEYYCMSDNIHNTLFAMKKILAVLFEKVFRELMTRRYLHWSG